MSEPVDCMPNGLLVESSSGSCPSSNHLLISLAAFNIWSALLTLVIGHDTVRQKMPSITKSQVWRPWSAVVTCLIHVLAMVIATVTLRSTGYVPYFEWLFSFWTMRPRATIAATIWQIIFRSRTSKGESPYLWAWKDAATQDTLLNIFASGFAAQWARNRPPSWENGTCDGNFHLDIFWAAIYIIIGVGVLSLIVVLLLICGLRKLPEWIAGITMFLSFFANWVIWTNFIITAGSYFCPGSLIGESITWAVALLIGAVLHPLIGGAQGC